MNLQELIKRIPEFISKVMLESYNEKKQSGKKDEDDKIPATYGKFHLGNQYDINIWLSNQNCNVFPCQEKKETII